MNAPKTQLHPRQLKALLELTDRFRANLLGLDHCPRVRTDFNKLREAVDHYLPPETPASEMPLAQRAVLTWKHRRGTRVRMDCPDEAGHGSVGIVERILVHNGPAILDYWEYSVRWESGPLAPDVGLCPERWLVEVPKEHGGAELAIEPEPSGYSGGDGRGDRLDEGEVRLPERWPTSPKDTTNENS